MINFALTEISADSFNDGLIESDRVFRVNLLLSIQIVAAFGTFMADLLHVIWV